MVYFRVDANKEIGAGHMMRCLTIAKALEGKAVFICADEDSAVLPRRAGYEVRVLGTDYRDMESELGTLSAVLAECREKGDDIIPENSGEGDANNDRPTIVVDSYQVTDAYLAVLRAFARVVLVDDNMERAYPADVILNYNFHADPDAYKALYANDGTRFLTGPSYAPVRAQFVNREYKVRETVEKVLILAGGSDPLNAAGEICRALRGITRKTESKITDINRRNNEQYAVVPTITIVCGKYNAHREMLEAYAKEDENLRILYDVEDMASLMCESDLCVSACGSTLYELCAVGLPFVCYALADNQEGLAAYLDANGPAPFVGAFHLEKEQTLERIKTEVMRLTGDYGERAGQCLAQRRLVDGKGAKRIASQMIK